MLASSTDCLVVCNECKQTKGPRQPCWHYPITQSDSRPLLAPLPPFLLAQRSACCETWTRRRQAACSVGGERQSDRDHWQLERQTDRLVLAVRTGGISSARTQTRMHRSQQCCSPAGSGPPGRPSRTVGSTRRCAQNPGTGRAAHAEAIDSDSSSATLTSSASSVVSL